MDKRKLLIFFISGILFFCKPDFLHAQVIVQPEVNIDLESGYPEFDGYTPGNIGACLLSSLGEIFPFDQLNYEDTNLIINNAPELMTINIWDNDYDMTFLLDIYNLVSPLILAGVLFNAILVL